MKLYEIIFFYIYRSLLKSNVKDSPIYFATLILSGLIFFNVLTIGNFIESLIGARFIVFDRFELLIIFLIIMAPNMFYLFRNKKHQNIIDRFQNAEKKTYKRRRLYVIVYIAFTFVLGFVSVLWKL